MIRDNWHNFNHSDTMNSRDPESHDMPIDNNMSDAHEFRNNG